MPYFDVPLRRQRTYIDAATLRVEAEDQNEADEKAVEAVLLAEEGQPPLPGVTWLTRWENRHHEVDVEPTWWAV